MRCFARRKLRKLMRGDSKVEDVLQTWRQQPIEYCLNINPYLAARMNMQFSDNPHLDYYPTGNRIIQMAGGNCTLDDLDDPNAAPAWDMLNKIGNRPLTDKEEEHLAHLFSSAGHRLFDENEFNKALRAFLNVYRIEEGFDPIAFFNLAKCYQELGDFKNAGLAFINAAEAFLTDESLGFVTAESRNERAADAFERAGLAWEAMDTSERQTVNNVNGHYNSSVCFRKAKFLYLSGGDTNGAARCSGLEADAARRWSQFGAGFVVATIIRWGWLYGESPVYAMRTTLLVWVVTALFFLFGGYQSNGVVYKRDFLVVDTSEIGGTLEDFGNALYLAAITISTLGYGDFAPASSLSKVVAAIASWSGVLLAAMLIITIQRRFVGR